MRGRVDGQLVGQENIDGSAAGELIGLLLDRVSAAVALFDRDMHYIAHNHRWITDYRLADTDLIGRSHYELFPEIGDKWRQLHRRALAGEKLSEELHRFERQDGTVDWIRWSLSPWRDTTGAVQGLLAVSEVLTPQVQEQLRLRIQDEELALFFDIAENFALCMLDDEGTVSIWNANAERLFGWDEAEALGRPFDFMFDPSDKDRGLPARQLELARQNGTYRDRCWRVRCDGSRFLADVTISRIESDAQFPSGYGQLVRDVTKEDTQSRSLEASAVLLHSILETIPDAMIVIDNRGIVLSFSKAAEQMFGYTQEEVIGRNVSMLMPSPDREQHDSYIARFCRTGEPRIIGKDRRVLGLRKDGTTFPHILSVGEAVGGGQRVFAGFLHDLTEAEENEKRFVELQRELTHIARVSEMGTLATAIAHELNQPLMAIGNYVQTSAQLIKDDGSKALETISGALEEASQEIMRAGAIIKRMRNFVSRGDLERTIEKPETLARDACALVAGIAKLRSVDCSLTVAESASAILVDRVQIQQVLLNLLRNAIDAIGDAGEVTIEMETDDEMVRFTVSDNGPGVPAERVARLFEPFSTSKPDGMGMGLAICRSIVEAHGGKLWYERSPSGGAAFIFTLPRFVEETSDVD